MASPASVAVAAILLLRLDRIVDAWPQQTSPNRREFLNKSIGAVVATIAAPVDANAAETIGKDPDCNTPSCLGVWDGLLADCPHGLGKNQGAGCVSSQDDTPGVFAEPWDYAEAPNDSLDYEVQMNLLVPALQLASSKRGDTAQVLLRKDRYLRVIFTDNKTSEKSVGEFYFTPDDTTVQFRIGSLGGGGLTSFKNLERAELIRKQCRFLKIPVLRNRKRTLFFVESELDSFGPGSAALGPPAEMTTGELTGRQDVDPKLKIDLTEQFPVRR